MKLLVETIEDFEVITESTKDGKKNYYIQGPFMQCETVNRNGRVYPRSVMESAVNKYIEDYVSKSKSVGTLGHENTPRVSEDKVSHLVKELKFNGNDVWGKAKVLETKHGKELAALIEGGVNFGCSSRSTGELKEGVHNGRSGVKIVQDGLSIACVDAVLNPSGISCYVEGIYEGVEWVFVENEGWVEQYKEEAQNLIRKTSKKDIEKVALQIFENYINRL